MACFLYGVLPVGAAGKSPVFIRRQASRGSAAGGRQHA